MNSIIHYNQCPLCSSTAIKNIFAVKDHSVSGESFLIAGCSDCGLRFTQDVPDPEGIKPYYRSQNYISHSNTSRGIVNRIYQRVRIKTLRQKRKLINRATGLSVGSLLELGSGTGHFAREMQEHGWNVLGLEPDAGARQLAKELNGIELQETAILSECRDATFDAAALWHVLEHVHDLHGSMSQLKRVLKDQGKLFIAVPNYSSKDAGIYKEYWAAWDVPRHLYHFSPQSMKKLLELHGFRIVQQIPMWYDSFYISLLSSQYRSGHSQYMGPFVNGLRSNVVTLFNKNKGSSIIYVAEKILDE